MIFVVLILASAAAATVARLRRARRDRGFVPELDAVGWGAGMRWPVVAPLARVEMRRLLVHPAFVAGVILTPAFLFLAAADSDPNAWLRISADVALALAPLGWFTIAATQLMTTRPARSGVDSLLASLPAPQPTRIAALLSTMVVSATAAAACIAATVVLVQVQDRVILGSPDVAELGVGVLLAAGAVAVGVAIARFLPHPIFAVAGAVAVILIQARFFEPTTWPWNSDEASPVRFFGFVGKTTSAWPHLEIRAAGWHLLYLVGLTAVMGVVALARNGVTRALAIALTLALGVTSLAGWRQAQRPSSAQVAAMVRYLEHPVDYEQCEDHVPGQFCTFPSTWANIPQWVARSASVLALVPATPRPLVVSERVPTVVGNSNCAPIPFAESLDRRVARDMDPAKVWAEDGAVHPGADALPCSDTSLHGLFFATQVGAWAVGLPSSPSAGDVRCFADGEARAALALWLGAAATPGGAQRLRAFADEAGTHLRFDGWNEPPMWGVHFAIDDARVALAMLGRPASDVAAALRPHWAQLTTKGTPTANLTSLLGLSPAAPATAVQSCA